ncbi:hypothetical protein LCGC14_2628140 [marine sediment metagenome]|uniref:Uncharacterized protein n=1 Tax=marine sediment metagenome TaxID=412755 RepID=A0A0F9CTM5_9ZZZZ
MARGLPDYGQQMEQHAIAGMADLGEAVARLDSINIFDRRGFTIWQDDFEAPGLKWITQIAGGGTFPVLSTTQAWMGIQSVYLLVGAAVPDRSRILKYFPLVRLGKIGFEFFTFLSVFTPSHLRLLVILYDGTNASQTELRLDNQARTATIVTPAGNIVVATFAFPLIAFNAFIPIKLVIDMDTDRYVRLLIGPVEIDLSAHALIVVGPTTQRLLEVHLELVGSAAAIGFSYIDNFILTQNEP